MKLNRIKVESNVWRIDNYDIVKGSGGYEVYKIGSSIAFVDSMKEAETVIKLDIKTEKHFNSIGIKVKAHKRRLR
jgi:hypothetical protein